MATPKEKKAQNKLVQDLVADFNKNEITSETVNADESMTPEKLLKTYQDEYKRARVIAKKAITSLASAIDKDEIVISGSIGGLEAVKNRLNITNVSATPKQIEELVRLARDKDANTIGISLRSLQQNLFGGDE